VAFPSLPLPEAAPVVRGRLADASLSGELRIARVPARARSLQAFLSVREREEFLLQAQVLLA
jgi:hypothetical protein